MPLHVCPTVAYLCRLISSSSLTVLRDYHTLFHNGCAFYVPISNVSPPLPLHLQHHFPIFILLVTVILIGATQSLLVVWICTSWVTGDVGHLSCASWPFKYLILKMSLQIICLSLNPVVWVVGSCVFWALSTCWVDSLPSHSGLFAPLVPLPPRFLFESEVMLFIIYCFLLPAFLGGHI